MIPVGTVIERPIGELGLLWRLYADMLERNRQLEKEARKGKRKA